MQTECNMVMVETPELNLVWECDMCGSRFKATKEFEKKENCPECLLRIGNWVDFGEDEL